MTEVKLVGAVIGFELPTAASRNALADLVRSHGYSKPTAENPIASKQTPNATVHIQRENEMVYARIDSESIEHLAFNVAGVIQDFKGAGLLP